MHKKSSIVILGVLLESGQPVSATRLMKLLFLVRKEKSLQDIFSFYDFVPYKFGPYSFAAAHDIRTLAQQGLLTGNRFYIPADQFHTAMRIYESLTVKAREAVRSTVKRHLPRSDVRLIDQVYTDYPAYTMLSERRQLRARPTAPVAIYTIGYEGISMDKLMDILMQTGILRLIDVRNNPLSRRFGFSRKTLAPVCERLAIDYIHIPELGIPSADRKALSDDSDYTALFDRYEKRMLPHQPEALARVTRLIENDPSVLMCYEAEASRCHRGRLAAAIAKRTDLPIKHLEAPRYGSQESSDCRQNLSLAF
ncbi:MAG: DUF488 domain-containing protein [Armatimonadetes bacterium]|nr:DUF488 domain-containing protein [Armatimonadota bacterium]